MRSYGRLLPVLLLVSLFCAGCATPPPAETAETYLVSAVAQAFWFSEIQPAAEYPTGVTAADKILAPLSPDIRARVIFQANRSLQSVTP